jgi:hypothetical protein
MNGKTKKNQAHRPSSEQHTENTLLLGIYLLAIMFTVAYLIFDLWPTINVDDSGKQVWKDGVTVLGTELLIGSDGRLILLVMLAGALGSCVHAATSFVTYVGNRSFVLTWTWWYILRPFIGMALALIFYCAIRGGLLLLSTGASADEISPHGMVALAGLVGMFSKRASDKLAEVFDNLFKTDKGDELRTDKLGEQLPVTEAMTPVNKISGHTIKEGEEEKDVKVKDLGDMLKGTVTRVPIFDHTGAVKYVIHESSLYKFIAEKSMAGQFDAATSTLEDFLGHPGMRELVADSLAFVAESATLIDAKIKMDATKHCQDVFVTENGQADEPVKGWLTNTKIGKHIKA